MGYYQILPGEYGGLEYYNTFATGRNYTTNDLWSKAVSKKIATWIIKRNLRTFSGCEVSAVNAYNMGVTRTRRGELYYPYCKEILGYIAVSNYLDDYWVTHKSKNRKVWYLRKK